MILLITACYLISFLGLLSKTGFPVLCKNITDNLMKAYITQSRLRAKISALDGACQCQKFCFEVKVWTKVPEPNDCNDNDDDDDAIIQTFIFNLQLLTPLELYCQGSKILLRITIIRDTHVFYQEILLAN